MNVIVAGGAGFIGINLIRKIIPIYSKIFVIDNLSNSAYGELNQISDLDVHFYNVDLSDWNSTLNCVSLIDAQFGRISEIWHLAANSNIPMGVNDARVDFKDTFITTFNLLEVAKKFGICTFHFASSSAIYGDLGNIELTEDAGPLLPISNYGAMKLASEALASAAAESYLSRLNIFRFPNVVGVPATHGVILDFLNKLSLNPCRLDVLGNGTQQKAYLHVSDLVDAMLLIRSQETDGSRLVVNIGPQDDGVTVRWIAEEVISRVGSNAEIKFGIGNKGWVGDVPRFNYSTQRLQSFGWTPRLSSAQAVGLAIDEIADQLGK